MSSYIKSKDNTTKLSAKIYIWKSSNDHPFVSIRITHSFIDILPIKYNPTMYDTSDNEKYQQAISLAERSVFCCYRTIDLFSPELLTWIENNDHILSGVSSENVNSHQFPLLPTPNIYLKIPRSVSSADDTVNDADDDIIHEKIKSNAIQKPQIQPSSSLFAQVMCWGRNRYNVMGHSLISEHENSEFRDVILEPTSLILPSIVILERIKMVSCALRHTLLLTYGGSLFACGDNSEGALGTGDTISRLTFIPEIL
jgi:hypothetical protein